MSFAKTMAAIFALVLGLGSAAQAQQVGPATTPAVTPTGSGVTNYVPLWTSASALGDSLLYQVNPGPGNSIGIGTTSPAARVHIVGTGGTIPSLIVQGGGGLGVIKMGGDVNANTLTPSVRKLARITMPDWAADSLGITLFSGDVTGANANDLYFGGTPGGSQYAATGLHFVTAANGTTTGGTERVTLTSAGSLGVGTTAPAAKLEVNGTAKFDGNITFASTQTFPIASNGITAVSHDSSLSGSGTSASPLALAKVSASSSFTGSGTSASPLGFSDSVTMPGTLTLNNGTQYPITSASSSLAGYGLYAEVTGGEGTGVYGYATGSAGWGVYGEGAEYGIYGAPTSSTSGGLAGYFDGDVQVSGNVSKAGGSFKIDDPVDPENKYLYHSFVESPDMMNVYNGNVVTDGKGEVTVTMPDYFEALNRDFRYQLTVIGQFAQAIVAQEVTDGKFSIRTDKPNVKVSWQVTGIRQDAWANAHRIPNEEQKPASEQGHYMHPELFGHADEPSIAEMKRAAHHAARQ
jgi:hypothetical protein